MKDLLFKRSRDWIKDRLEKQYSGSFIRIQVDEEPELTGAGKKALFSDGRRVIGEGEIREVGKDEVRIEPLTAVRKPDPKTPPKKGYEYVDVEDCGQYSIEFMGVEHVYLRFHALVKGVLKNMRKARNSEDLLCHVVWTEVQNLDLNQFDEFSERQSRGTTVNTRDELQVERCVYPPTEPEVVEERFRESSKASRLYDSLEEYVEQVKEFYRERGEARVVEQLDEEFDDPSRDNVESARNVVKEKVANDGSGDRVSGENDNSNIDTLEEIP